MSPAIELTDDPGVLRFTSPTGVKDVVKKSLGARTERKGDGLLLPATTLSVQRLIDYYGHAILEGAPEVAVELGTAEWGFRGFDPDERDRAEAHRSWGKMLPFQRVAIEYLVCNPHAAALLGLSPGLGKSAVSIVAADLLGFERILVLAPVSLTFNWQREFELWAEDPNARSFKRATADDREPGDGVTIANHEVIQEVIVRNEEGEVATEFELDATDENGEPVVIQATNARAVRAWIDEGPRVEDPKSGKLVAKRERLIRIRRDYRDAGWDGVIVDESILLKNRKAKKTEVLTTLRKSMDGDVWMLSGSPIAKHRDDLWRQLNIAAPRAFTSYWRFAEFFCVVEKGQWGWSIIGDAPDVDVHKYLRDYVFIRSQDDVLPDLPDYVIRDLELMPTKQQRKALDSMIDDWIAVLDSAPDEPVIAENWLSRMTRLQQLTSNVGSLPKDDGTFHRRSSAKEDALVDLIEQGDIELPLLVWTWYVETTNSVTERLSKFKDLAVGKVVGGGKRAATDATIEAFKSGDLDVLVLQMGVGKFGHTFTGTRTIYYHDRAFDSDAWVQSLRRVRRIGLKHRPVLIVPRLQRDDPDDDRVSSADQIIDENLAGKMRSIADMTNSDLSSLLGRRRIDG